MGVPFRRVRARMTEGAHARTEPPAPETELMTSDMHLEPRCSDCDATLVRAGATCISCQHDEHYEGFVRTSPPIKALQSRDAETARAS